MFCRVLLRLIDLEILIKDLIKLNTNDFLILENINTAIT